MPDPVPASVTRTEDSTTPDLAADSEPALSVVLGTRIGLERLRRVLDHLGRQTIRHRIELIVVAPSERVLGHGLPMETEGLHRIKKVFVGPIDNLERSLAEGVRAATAPLVALLEDHAFPAPDWAERLVETHAGPWTVVGTAVDNGNPRTALSWANLLIAYGHWVGMNRSEEATTFSRLNSCYKREALLSLSGSLEDLLVRGGGLVEALREAGHRFYVDARTSVAHVNPSRLGSTVWLRFNAGRLYGGGRVASGWSLGKRLLFAVIGPPLRLQKIVRRAWSKRGALPAKPALGFAFAFCLLLDGLGETVGCLAGSGRSAPKLAVFEMDRHAHVTTSDQHLLVEPREA